MSTTVRVKPRLMQGEHRFLLPGIGWGGYEALLAMIGDGRTRVTYCEGDAELMSPLPPHEHAKKRLAFIVETLGEELGLEFLEGGSTTFRSEELGRGLEPDECYYFESTRRLSAGAVTADLAVDPPPDLAIEVEFTTSAIGRLPIYGALGVGEVWRYDGEVLTVHLRRDDGTYEAGSTSRLFPLVPISDLHEWLLQAQELVNSRPWRLAFRAWVRDEIVPRHEAGRPPGT